MGKGPITGWLPPFDAHEALIGGWSIEPALASGCLLIVNQPLTSFPIFPLGLLPLPGEQLALHIFEPRYQFLFNQLEANELEEFGIAFHATENAPSKNAPILGGIMRLLFSTAPNAEGARDALVQCVSLFSTSTIYLPGPGEQPPFPTADIVRLQHWKNWEIPEHLQSELNTLSTHWKSQGNQAETNQRPTTLIESMLRYDFNAQERHNILWNATEDEVKNRFSDVIRFKALIVQQMQLKHRGQFPN
jgi:hypothetical protein